MPFVAISRQTGDRINILDGDPRGAYSKDDLRCPLCDSPFIVVDGFFRIRHFRHKVECTSTVARHPESIHHLLGKQYVYTLLKEKYAVSDVMLEVTIPEANRRADVLVIFPNGWREAHEIQLSPISTHELAERTRTYREAGIDVCWWLGDKASGEDNQRWCIENFGDVRILEYSKIRDE